MLRARTLSGLIPLLLIAAAAAIPCNPASAQEPTATTTASTDTPPMQLLKSSGYPRLDRP